MKCKVLFLIESLAGGGAEKVLTTLVQNIDKEKFDVTVCAISGGGKYEETVKEHVRYKAILAEPRDGNPLSRFFYVIKHHLVYKWLSLSWVYRMFVPQDNDVEVAYVEGFTTKLLSHSTNRKAKKYAWVHIDLHHNHWTKSVYDSRREESEAYNRFYKIVGVSRTVVDSFKIEFPDVNVPMEVVYNPIDSSSILSLSKEPHPDMGKHEVIRMVTTGRLEPQKAYGRLVKIIRRLLKEDFSTELWILGDGTERKMLEEYIVSNQLGNVIQLLGFQTNPYKFLAQGDLFVCSSLAEGYSTAVTEALILALPVITTDCSGMGELLKDGEYGIITENSEDALYEGLKTLLSNTELLNYYKRKSVERGRDFQIETLMKPVENLLMT